MRGFARGMLIVVAAGLLLGCVVTYTHHDRRETIGGVCLRWPVPITVSLHFLHDGDGPRVLGVALWYRQRWIGCAGLGTTGGYVLTRSDL